MPIGTRAKDRPLVGPELHRIARSTGLPEEDGPGFAPAKHVHHTGLLAEVESLEQLGVFGEVVTLQVIEKLATTTCHGEETPT